MQKQLELDTFHDSKSECWKTKEIIPGDAIHEAVHEFLLKNGYFRTLDAFQDDLLEQNSNVDCY